MPNGDEFGRFVRELLLATAARDTQETLDGAAKATLELVRGVGVSLIFMGSASAEGHAGGLSVEGDAQLQEWERALRTRLSKGRLELRADVAPVSRRLISKPIGTLISSPLLWGRRMVGLVAAEIQGEMSDVASDLIQRASPVLGSVLSLTFEADSSRRKLGELSMIFQSGQAVVASPQFPQALHNTLSLAARMVDAEGCAALLSRPEKQLRAYIARRGAERSEPILLPLEGIVGHVAEKGEVVALAGPSNDPRYSVASDGRLAGALRSIAVVPLLVRGRSVGALAAFNQLSDTRFSEDDLWLLDGVAAHVGVVVENDRLYEELRHERDRVLEAQEVIRNDLAHGLHRGPIQLLSALTLSLDHAERLAASKPAALPGEIAAMRGLARQAAHEARLLLFELRPAVLETEGLASALRTYASQLQTDKPPMIHPTVPDLKRSLEPKVARAAFGIVQEALSNALRHGKAEHIWLQLEEAPDALVVRVLNDGEGFDVVEALQRSVAQMRLGLSAMQRQAELIGATLGIESKLGTRGTAVVLTIGATGGTD